jgi:hypothetical protein
MTYRPVLPVSQSLPIRPLVLLLHPLEQAAVACELVRAWRPSIPVADVFTVSVVEGGRASLSDLPAALLDGSGPRKRPLVLVGVCGAEAAALQLGFDHRLPQCAGVLAAGRVMPPLEPLAVRMAGQAVRVRLIWEVSDSANWASALGELLSWYRAAGLDAQGVVLERACSAPADECGAGCSLSPTLVRMGRIYLAELVAVAMGGQRQPQVSHSFRLGQQVDARGQ